MKNYTKPEIKIAFFEAEDVMTINLLSGVQQKTSIPTKEITSF